MSLQHDDKQHEVNGKCGFAHPYGAGPCRLDSGHEGLHEVSYPGALTRWEEPKTRSVTPPRNPPSTLFKHDEELTRLRGEVERLTVELRARDKRVAEQRRQLSSLEANYIGTQKVLIGYISKTPARIAEALKDTHVNTVVFMESLNTAIARAETAEASLRSLRDALELVNQRFGVHSGECFTCDHYRQGAVMTHSADCPIPTIERALTPAAPDSTKSTESTAARKSNDLTTPTTDASRNGTSKCS